MWLTYEALTATPEQALAQVMGFHGIDKSDADIAHAIASVTGGNTSLRCAVSTSCAAVEISRL